MKDKVLEFLNEKQYQPMSLEELSKALNIKEASLKEALGELEADYIIKQTKKRKYDLMKRFNLYVGIIDIKEKGFGFIRSEDFVGDFFVSQDFIGGSMDNDKVLFTITENTEVDGLRKEAAVVEVIERHLKEVIGEITAGKKGKKKFKPSDKSLDLRFEVTDFGISVPGDVAIFAIDKYVNAKHVIGSISKVIGNVNDVGIEIKSIAYKYGFESEFPEEVLDEVRNLNIDYQKEAITRERIFDNVITIDGADAKDLDDAVSIKKLDNGNYLLGVYIADVSYYVDINGKLNEEAYERGTSVYLTDRVIPMLPHKLSNDLCSLNPGEDKLVIACEMEIDDFGRVVDHKIFPGIINTTKRMTYENVNLMLEAKDKSVIKIYEDIYPDLVEMENLAVILREMRERRGSLDFDVPEGKIIVDENGYPTDVVLIKRGVGEKLIEEFMLIANETVADVITNMQLPFIYRVHDNPNELKLDRFTKIAGFMGYKVRTHKNKIHPHQLQKVLKEIKEEDQGLKTLLLRMMAKAKYSSKNIGHYGLASSCYTHFTAPIRRYPDLIVHRLLRKYLFDHEVSVEDQEVLEPMIRKAAEHASKRERDAIECEYEVNDMKKAEYMEDHVGKVFPAAVTSVTNFGMFASLANTIEGLIHVKDLDGYYKYDENRMALVSNKDSFRIGDKINVRVKKASKETGQIDFELVRSGNNGKRKKRRRKKQKS